MFHNLKKSFMHALVSLFIWEILDCYEISEVDTENLLNIVHRMRSSSIKIRKKSNGKNSPSSGGEVQTTYEYYSHSHYNAMFLQLTPKSLLQMKKKPFDLNLHRAMFKEDIDDTSSPCDNSVIICNYYKALIFSIVDISLQYLNPSSVNNLTSK